MSDVHNGPPRHTGRRIFLVLAVLLLALAAAGFYLVLPGFSAARNEPSRLEVRLATFMLKHSVPASEAAKTNPLNAQPDAANIRAGHDLFTAKCAACHAYDGGGRT